MFKIIILQETLKIVLDYLSPTVGKNSQNLGDDCISLESTDTGSCIFYTTNTLESTVIEAICSNQTQAAIAPFVNFKRFKGIIDSIPSNEYITIEEATGQLLISFSMRKSPIVINANSVGMLAKPPIINTLAAQMIEFPVNFFNQVITKGASIINDSPTVQIMNCVKITVGNPEVTAEAIDINSKRTFMMTDTFGLCNTQETFLIEASKMVKSLKLFEDFSDFEIGHDNAFIIIKGKNRLAAYNRKHQNASNDIVDVSYVLRQLNGAFPSVSQYYTPAYQPAEYITVSKEDILNSIARIKALGDDTSFLSGINIKADKKDFLISFNSQHGKLEDPVDVINGGISGSFNMIFNHTEFEEIIKNIRTEYIDIGLMHGSTSNFIIKGGTGISSTPYNGTDKFTMISKAIQQQTP